MFSKLDKLPDGEASSNSRSFDVATHDKISSASISSLSVTGGNSISLKSGTTSSAKAKQSPHQRNESSGKRSESMSSLDDSIPSGVVSNSASSQKKRSRNDLSSLFDSLSQFFSTTAERRRRTPFVSSYASDISTAVWLSKKQSSASSAKQESSKHCSLQNKIDNEPAEKPFKAAVNLPAKQEAHDDSHSSGDKTSKQKYPTYVGSNSKTKNTSQKQKIPKLRSPDNERQEFEAKKAKRVLEADSGKAIMESPKGLVVPDTKLAQSLSDVGISPVIKRRSSVKSDNNVQSDAATDPTDSRRVTRRTWLQPNEDSQVDMKQLTYDTPRNTAALSETLKLFARRSKSCIFCHLRKYCLLLCYVVLCDFS